MSLTFHIPAVYLITKGESTTANFEDTKFEILELVKIAIEAKVPFVQLREKALPVRMLLELALQAVAHARGSDTRILINDRADVALAAGADGVHLTANSVPAGTIRKNFPPDFIIGVSTHSLSDASSAANDGADFAVFGPVFETPGKGKPQGIEKLKEACEQLDPFPVFGLGGIDESNFAAVIAAKAKGFAAIRSLNDSDGMRSILARLRQ